MKKYTYECDGGSLAVMVNGAKLQIGNGYGDGVFSAFVLEDGDDLDQMFKNIGVSIYGPAKIEILDYDCGESARVIGEVELKDDDQAFFYRNVGDVAIEIFRRKDCENGRKQEE